MPIFDPIRIGASGGSQDYEVERSLRFNSADSTKLTRTFGTNTSNTTKTVSFWMKRGKAGVFQSMFSTAVNGFVEGRIQFTNDDKLQYTDRDSSSGSTDIQKITNRVFRDHSAWYHIVVAINTTDGTANDRVKIYINGVRETSFSSSTNPSQNYSVSFYRSSADNYVGVNNNSSDFFNGYLAEINFIDGQALDPSSFAKTNTETGEWIPKKYTGGYGNNGYYLNFSDNSGTSATTLGKDNSGNGNNFTPSNFNVTAGSVENDSVLDSPTNNWCTLNPLTGFWNGGGQQVLEDGLLFSDNPNSGDRANHATFRLKPNKKYYIEGVYLEPSGSGSQLIWGLTTLTKNNGFPSKAVGTGGFSINWRGGAGTTQSADESTQTNIGTRPSNGAVIGVAIDLVNGKFYAHNANSYYNSGNPDNGTGAIITGIPTDVEYNFTTSVDSGGPNFSEFKINFGQQGFQHQPSTFTDLLNSQSLDEPTIPNGSKYFDTVLYTGNGTDNTDRTGLNFAPDWVWIKARSAAKFHSLYDAVRGAGKVIYSAMTNAEGVDDGLKAFNSDGFRNGTNQHTNENGTTYAAWCWEAGSSTVTNTDGSISAQVRAEPEAGFSIVTYTGTGADATIGHGLGVKPDAIFLKNRDRNVDWIVKHQSLTSNKIVYLNLTEAEGGATGTNNGVIEDLSSSSTFSISRTNNSGNYNNVGVNGEDYVAYCFSGVEGYSKFGKYTGNGSTNGTFVFTGFRPAWVMVKNKDSSYSWDINDSARDPDNVCEKVLAANLDDSEATATSMDFLSNGFKLRVNNNSQNRNGDDFIYFAFAEQAFKHARAR